MLLEQGRRLLAPRVVADDDLEAIGPEGLLLEGVEQPPQAQGAIAGGDDDRDRRV
jgi:hypothetical protein